MNRVEHLLFIVSEECAETAQRASKAARFGLFEVQPGQQFNNAQRLIQEYTDLVATMEMLIDEGCIPVGRNLERYKIEAKKKKIEEFFKRSRQNGTLDFLASQMACSCPLGTALERGLSSDCPVHRSKLGAEMK